MNKEELIEKIMHCCFADDSSKYDKKNKKEYKFWDNFSEINIEEWKEQGSKIYDANTYESLPDPDACSKNLYRFHGFLWTKQQANMPEFDFPNKVNLCEKSIWYEINGTNTTLASDSVMSIYWHWAGKIYPYKKMQDIIKSVSTNIVNTDEYKEICSEIEENFSAKAKQRCKQENNTFKKFIGCYLQKSNTVGGFVLFPRHTSSINSSRGCCSKIRDRFDLTLECIRRAYQYRDFYKTDNNPLFGITEEDKSFFKIFGSFEGYAKFFCLDKSWVKDGKVLNLLYDKRNGNRFSQTLDNWDFNQEPLPQDDDEWWVFYRNIMSRLKERNKQMEYLLRNCSEDELQKLYNALEKV